MIAIDMFRLDDNTMSISAGETIFHEGEPGDRMYVLVEGEVDLVVNGTAVERLTVGGVFGEMALLDAEPRIATAIARTDCKIVPIDQRRFTFLVQQTPNFALQLLRVIADRLRRMDQRL